jgi:hypothetical protein
VLRRIFGTKWEEARNKLCGLSPQTNYTDWATATCRRN